MATSPVEGERRDPREPRMSLRRARSGGGFSSGSSTHLEGFREPDDDDQDLQEEPVVDASAAVVSSFPRLAPPPAPVQEDDRDENRRRLAEATMAGDPEFAREFRLGLLHRLMMRGISMDNIARELGVSLTTVKNDKAELKRRLRATAMHLDVNELIGGQMAFYDEVSAMALRVSSQQGAPTAMRLASMRTALAAKADQTRFLTSAGVFDVMSYRRTETGEDLSDVQVLMRRTEEMIERLMAEDTPADGEAAPPAPPAAPRRVIRRVRPGGFAAMSFDDSAASGSGDEVVTI